MLAISCRCPVHLVKLEVVSSDASHCSSEVVSLRRRCAFESMHAALNRYHMQGLYAIERSSAAAIDRLSVAAKQLPDADNEVKDLMGVVGHSAAAACDCVM